MAVKHTRQKKQDGDSSLSEDNTAEDMQDVTPTFMYCTQNAQRYRADLLE